MAKEKEMRAKAKPGDKRIGNSFWTNRSKHGRDKIFSSPEILWETAMEYFQLCEENPILKNDYKGGFATEVNIKIPRPYTWQGLSSFCDCTAETLINYGKKEEYKDFFQILTRIDDCIRDQKLTGATAGLYNATIVSRDLGLKDGVDLSSKDGTMTPKTNVIVSDVKTKEALDKIISKISKK